MEGVEGIYGLPPTVCLNVAHLPAPAPSACSWMASTLGLPSDRAAATRGGLTAPPVRTSGRLSIERRRIPWLVLDRSHRPHVASLRTVPGRQRTGPGVRSCENFATRRARRIWGETRTGRLVPWEHFLRAPLTYRSTTRLAGRALSDQHGTWAILGPLPPVASSRQTCITAASPCSVASERVTRVDQRCQRTQVPGYDDPMTCILSSSVMATGPSVTPCGLQNARRDSPAAPPTG
jgi:hypothetical protein